MGSEVHPDLTRHVSYVCRPCGERSTSVKLIDKHIRECHGADYPRQARDLYLLRDKVYVQSVGYYRRLSPRDFPLTG